MSDTDNNEKPVITLPRPPAPGRNGHNESAVVKIVGDTQLPREFITVGRDFDEALGRTALFDENQLNDVVAYKAQLMEFNMLEELQDLVSWLNGRPAIGGYNRLHALMAHIGILAPEAVGVKLSKETTEQLKRLNDMKTTNSRRQNDQHDNT